MVFCEVDSGALFWKIMGLYAVLSLLALIGLLVALNAGQSAAAVAHHTREIHHRLGMIRDELAAGEDPNSVLRGWQQTFQREGQELWLVDQNFESLTISEVELPHEITLQSVIQSAIRSGESMQRIHIHRGDPEVFAFGLDVSADEARARALGVDQAGGIAGKSEINHIGSDAGGNFYMDHRHSVCGICHGWHC